MTGFGWNHEWDMSNILLGAAAHWSSSGVKWILALDENCGPTLPLVTFTSGRPLVSIPSDAAGEEDIYYNQDYFSIKHMSKFLVGSAPTSRSTAAIINNAVDAATAAGTGTVRVGITASTGTVDANVLIVESFYHAASQVVTVIAMNKDNQNEQSVTFTQGGKSFSDVLPVFSTKVYQWIKE